MSEARCTLQVRGLDCPKEVDSLTAALKDRAGVARLGFDLIHGTMTVDYDDDLVEPAGLARLITERTGLQSTVAGRGRANGPVMVVAARALGCHARFRAGVGRRAWLSRGWGRHSVCLAGRCGPPGTGGLCIGRRDRRYRDFSAGRAEPGAAAV